MRIKKELLWTWQPWKWTLPDSLTNSVQYEDPKCAWNGGRSTFSQDHQIIFIQIRARRQWARVHKHVNPPTQEQEPTHSKRHKTTTNNVNNYDICSRSVVTLCLAVFASLQRSTCLFGAVLHLFMSILSLLVVQHLLVAACFCYSAHLGCFLRLFVVILHRFAVLLLTFQQSMLTMSSVSSYRGPGPRARWPLWPCAQ